MAQAMSSYPEAIQQAVLGALRKNIEEAAEQEMEKAVTAIRGRVHEIVAKVALGLATQVTFSVDGPGRQMSIRVLMQEEKKG